MSLTRAIQIFLVQKRHMALRSTNTRFFCNPFLKETDQELHLRAGGSARWRRKLQRASNAQGAASCDHHMTCCDFIPPPHLVGLWEGEQNPATKPVLPWTPLNGLRDPLCSVTISLMLGKNHSVPSFLRI